MYFKLERMSTRATTLAAMSANTDVEWLTATEDAAWRGWLEATQRIAAAIEHDLRQVSGLTFDDYEVLVNLSEADGRAMRMSELAARTVQSASRLSQRVDRLTDKGFVERRRCDEDKRGFFAVLTGKGLACLADAAPGHVESVRRHLFDLLSPTDVTALAELMPRVAAASHAARVDTDG
jgi:DNA-binding MarR family transcriptional regulator